jgi:DNA repair photolyase
LESKKEQGKGTSSAPIRGRGASTNPANRFERLRVIQDPPMEGEEPPAPQTEYLKDTSHSIVAFNESPDVGFDAGINPYRGCLHGCVYCIHPDTPILYADASWRPIGNVRAGDVLLGFDEFPIPGSTRKFRPAIVEQVWWSKKPTVRLMTEHSEVTTTPEHRWLQARDFRWSRTEQLSRGRLLRYIPMAREKTVDEEYRAGYLAGLSLGDGTFRYKPWWRNSLGFPRAYWRVALVDDEPLSRAVDYLRSFRIEAGIRPFSSATVDRKALNKVEIRSLPKLEALSPILHSERQTRGYRRGFLAGFFDAEGYSGDVLRISQVDCSVLERVQQYAGSLGFDFKLEPREGRASTLRLIGRLSDRLRFFTICQPAIQRKIHALFGREMNLDPESVLAVEPGPSHDVVDIQTSSGTFFAAGLATHNCFARPTHEFLGFSAGLDFETKILVKENAPELLRAELSSPRWVPRPLALSGVTDPFQPVEKKLGITRRCLEVLAEFKNPVIIITKNHLVTRDIDLLAELAQADAVAVRISVTTLDQSLARVMEPRTSTPARRLEAIQKLADAGIPVGTLVAPVVPGLTDHEMPAIIQAVANAGGRFAGFTILRLPYGVKELFDNWLSQHYPDRRERVLNHVREIRGGKLNDPRFGSRLKGEGVYAEHIASLFSAACRKAGISEQGPALSTSSFRRPAGSQLALFG